MLIKQKANNEYLKLGIALIGIAILLFFALVSVDFPAGNIAGGLGKFFSLILFIFGLAKMQTYHEYKQEKEITFDIKNKKAFCNDTEYLLANAYMSIDFKQSDDFYQVTLWHETKTKTVAIFEDVVLDSGEMQNFLELIKPYRKTEICLLENQAIKSEENTKVVDETVNEQCEKVKEIQKVQRNRLIGLFDKGLIVENREILYNEIVSFSATITKKYEKRYLDVNIVLKNGAEIKVRLKDENEQAKALYAHLFFTLEGKISQEDYICERYNFWVAFVILTLLAVGFSGELGWIAIIVAFYISVSYFGTLIEFFYKKSLCKKVQEIIRTRGDYDKV